MKKLIVSIKSSSEVLSDFKKAFLTVKNSKKSTPHFELSFDNKSDFNKFIRNIDILSAIIKFSPNSIYELAKILNKDLSNLLKIIKFYEECGVLILKKKTENRERSTPIVEFDCIEFNLAA